MASVNVIQAGKAKNVPYDMTNVKSRIATAMDTVSTENVLVSEDIRASFVQTSTVPIQLAPAMVSALKAPAYARKAGKGLTVQLWIRTRYNVFQTAPDMALSMLIPRLALAMLGGLAMTVPKVHFFFQINKIFVYCATILNVIGFMIIFAEICDLDCGLHGRCVGESCVCDPGWTGEFCTSKLCDARCSDHGQCKNGTCLCVSGWNGRHCTLEGCPRGCAGHGQCKVANDGQWSCKCFDGWDGPDCTTLKEQICDDGKDNDKGMCCFDVNPGLCKKDKILKKCVRLFCSDGLVDCEDPECCLSPICKGSQLCVSSPKPTDILLRKQPPAITASFFERMKFIIDEGSLQNYAKQENFNERLVLGCSVLSVRVKRYIITS